MSGFVIKASLKLVDREFSCYGANVKRPMEAFSFEILSRWHFAIFKYFIYLPFSHWIAVDL